MERIDFILKLFELYPNSFTEKNKPAWREAYERVLPLNADFDILYETLLNKYTNTTAPKPAWLKENMKFDYSQSEQNSAIGNIKCVIYREVKDSQEKIIGYTEGAPYDFSYLRREMNSNQAVENLKNMVKSKSQKIKDIQILD